MQKQSPQKDKREKSKQKNIITQNHSKDTKKFEEYAFLTASLLRDLIQDDYDDEQTSESEFDSDVLKAIDLKTYIESVHKETNFEPECLIIALIYMDRYNLSSQEFSLRWCNLHKLLLSCLLLATKFHDEVYFDNKAFEIGGGVNNVKLIELETLVFERIEFKLFVGGQQYDEFLQSLYKGYYPQLEQTDQTLNLYSQDLQG